MKRVSEAKGGRSSEAAGDEANDTNECLEEEKERRDGNMSSEGATPRDMGGPGGNRNAEKTHQ
jgi:hypothetical protein